MNRPIVMAQLGGATPTQSAQPVRIIKLAKPDGGQAQTVFLGYDQKFKLDLSAIANEKITFVHVGERLVILFDNQSTLTLDPFFDSSGAPRANIAFDVNGREMDGNQFAAAFPITNDQSVLPAAGDGAAGGPASGANFGSSAVDPFSTPNPLDLLGQEELGTFTVEEIIRQNLDVQPVGGGHVSLLVDDQNLPTGTTPGAVTDSATLSFTAGSAALTSFVFGVTSGLSGALIWTLSADGHTITGSDERGDVVRLTLSVPASIPPGGTGTITVTVELLANFDTHPGLNIDDLFNLGSVTVIASAPGVIPVIGTVTVGVSDDVPTLVGEGAHVNGVVLEDGLSTLTGDFSNGNREAGETDASDEASGVAGSLTTLFHSGADAPLTFTLSTTTGGLPALFSHGDQLTYTVNGNVLTASSSTNVVFTLTVNPNGSWTFDLIDQLDHVDNGLNDENFDLVGINGSSVPLIDFSSIIIATDSDGDRAPTLPAGSFTVQVQDDVPIIEGVETIYTSTGNPIFIPDAGEGNGDGGGGASTIQSIIHVPPGGSITDLNVVLHLQHTFMSDLVVTLRAPDGMLIELFSHIGGGGDPNGGPIVIDDEAAQNIDQASQPFNGTWRPEASSLALLDGMNVEGDWTLIISDTVGGDDGFLNSWQLVITTGGVSSANQTVAVDEDDLNGPLSFGNNDTQAGDDLPINNSPSVTGTLAFNVGADEPADVTFAAMDGQTVTGTFSNGSTGQIESQDRPLTYVWDAATHTLYATWDTSDAANNAAFKVVVTDPTTGAYTLTLLDQLDHLPNFGGGDGPPSDDVPTFIQVDVQEFRPVQGTAFEDNIHLNLTYTVTDFDGDEVNGTVNFDIDDDVPTLTGTTILRTVDEDDIDTAWSTGTSPNDGNADGSITENSTGAAFISGSLTSLVSIGADEFPADNVKPIYGFTDNVVEQMTALGLYSKQSTEPATNNGLPLYYTTTIDGDWAVLSGFEPDTPGPGDTGNPVFELRVNQLTGDYEFRLFDELIHQLPADFPNGADENFVLRSGPNGFISAIDFGSFITVTDFDDDQITLAGRFQIQIRDDIPQPDVDTTGESVTIDETPGNDGADDVSFGSLPGSAQTAFGLVANTGNDPDVGNVSLGAIGFAHDPDPIVFNDPNGTENGADAPPASVVFSLAIVGGSGVDSGLDTTEGNSIFLFQEGNTIVGRVQGGPFAGQAAFAIHINQSGEVSVAQWLSLAHDDRGDPDESNDNGNNANDAFPDDPLTIQQTLDGKINAVLTITDSDGDAVSDSVGIGSHIVFQDDGPKFTHLESNQDVTHDETPGLQDDDVAAANVPAGALTAFGAVGNVGDDPDVPPASGPIGYAVSNGSIVDVQVNYGADGKGAPLAYALSLSSNNVHSGLTTTDGRDIHLFREGNIIVGRYEVGGDNVPDGSGNEPAAFAIYINPTTGQVTTVQYVSLSHPDNNDTDEEVDINNDILFVGVTAVDGDGDPITEYVDIGTRIEFDDDAPNPAFTLFPGSIIHDESVGVDADAQDIAFDASLPGLFAAVTFKGNDPDESVAPEPEIGYARSTGPIVSIVPNFGADGPGANGGINYAIDVPNGSNALSGLQTTDGRNIRLFEVNSTLVVGRYEVGGNNDPDGSGADEPAAFAIHIDPTTGVVTVVQYVSIKHDDRGDPDEANDNGNNVNDAPPNDALTVQQAITTGALRVTATVTDGDGDSVTYQANIGNKIIFQDDGPDILSVTLNPTFRVVHDETPGVQSEDEDSTSIPAALTTIINSLNTASNNDPHAPPAGNGPIGHAVSDASVFSVVNVNYGVDGPASPALAYTINLNAAPNTGVDSGLDTTEGRNIYLFQVDANLIVGRFDNNDNIPSASDPAAFAIWMDPSTGELHLVQWMSIHHQTANNPDEILFLNGTLISAVVTATDGDGDSDSESVNITGLIGFSDDGPTVNAEATPVTGSVEEDGMTLPSAANEGTNTSPDTQDGNKQAGDDSTQDQTSGASGSLSPLVNFGSDGPAANGGFSITTTQLSSLPTLYSGGQPVVYSSNGTTLTATNSAGQVVFTLTVNANGSWNFDLDGQLDHVDDALNAENSDLRTNASGSTSTPSIDFSSIVVATDADGDSITGLAPGRFQISVQDDIPTIVPPVGSAGPNLITNGGFETGHGLSLENFDTFLAVPGWVANNNGTPGNPNDDIPFEIQRGFTIGGLAPQQGEAKLELDSDLVGTGTDGNPTNFTNSTIEQTVAGTVAGQIYELSFYYSPRPAHGNADSSSFQVLWNGAVVYTFDSTGVPVGWQNITLLLGAAGPNSVLGFRATGQENSLGAYIDNVSLTAQTATVVDEDGLTGPLSVGNNDSAPGDDTAGNFDGDNNEATATGVLGIVWGADAVDATDVGASVFGGLVQDTVDATGDRSVIFSSATPTISGISGPLTSHGDLLSYSLTNGGTRLIATAPDARVVFEVTLSDDGTGRFRFVLRDQLDHTSGQVENNLSLGFSYTATDSDADSVAGSFAINVDDDMPRFSEATNAAVDEDDLTGAGHPGNSDVAAGDNLADPSPVAVIGNFGINFGADGPAANNAISGVTFTPAVTSDGLPVSMFLDAGTGIWYGRAGGIGGDNVFSLAFNTTTGQYTFTLLDNLDHPVAGTEDNIVLNFSFTATDFDGDTAAGSFSINVDDDMPVTTPATNLLVNGDFVGGTFNGQGDFPIPGGWGDNGHGGIDVDGIEGWTVTGGQIERVGNNYLGMTTSNGNPMVDMAASPGNIQIAQTINGLTAGSNYVIQFEAGTPVIGTALLEVLWNGVVVATINPPVDSMVPFNLSVVAIAGANTLTFREIGDDSATPVPEGATQGYHGTYLANIGLVQVATVDEDGLTLANSFGNAVGIGDSTQIGDAPTNSPTVTQSLGIAWGADDNDTGADVAGVQDVQDGVGDRSLTFTNATVTIGGVASLTSNGDAVSYQLVDNGTRLVGYVNSGPAGYTAGERLVFEVTLSDDNTGAFTFTLRDNLDHAPGANENDISLSFNYTARDSDGDTATGSFIVSVDDDMPIASALTQTATVDEDGVLEGPADAGPGDGIAGGPAADVSGEAVTATGFVNTLFTAGADAPLTYSINPSLASLIGQGLSSGGVPLSYAVTLNAGVYTLTASVAAGPVFTFTLNQTTGAWTFTLVDQLDHALGNGENDLTIQLGSLIVGTDSDGDSAQAASNAIQIIVNDDTPIQTNATVTAAVAEDELTGQSVGNPEADGINTVATGTLASLAQSGADESVTFSLIANPTGLPSITSQGDTVVYNVTGNVLTGYVDTGLPGFDASDRRVFTLNVQPNGTFTFTLLDQIDHLPNIPANNDDQNLVLDFTSAVQFRDADGDYVQLQGGTQTSNVGIGLHPGNYDTLTVAGVTFDGLTFTASGAQNFSNPNNNTDSFNVSGQGVGIGNNHIDDNEGFMFSRPGTDSVSFEINGSATGTISWQAYLGGVPVSGNSGFANGSSAIPANGLIFTIDPPGTFDRVVIRFDVTSGSLRADNFFYSTTTTGGVFTISVEDDIPIATAGTVTAGTVYEDALPTGHGEGAFQVVALTITAASLGALVSIGADEPGNFVLNSAADGQSAGVNSHGLAVTWDVVDASTIRGVTSDNRVVFELIDNDNGTFTFTLLDQVDHGSLTSGLGDSELLTLNIGALFAVSDFDGDTVALTGAVNVAIENDIGGNTTAFVSVGVAEDHLSTAASDNVSGIPTGTVYTVDEVQITTAQLLTLVSPGADEEGTFSLDQNVTGIVFTTGSVPVTSHGELVWLDYVGGQIIGFADSTPGGTYQVGERIVFTLTPNAGGFVFDLRDQLDHGLPFAAPAQGEAGILTLDLSRTILATDFDGDSITLGVGSIRIAVENDVPSLVANPEPVSLVVDETNFGFDATQNFTNFFVVNYGADGPGGLSNYSLHTSGAPTGLFDTLTGSAVVLTLEGVAVVGRADGLEVFRVTVDGLGAVTLNQSRAVVHNDPLDPVETGASAAGLSGANLITLSATITDYDGDAVPATVDITATLRFEDDGPSIDLSEASVPTLTTDDTNVPGSSSSASFESLFTHNFGADGFKDTDDNDIEDANAIRYALGLTGGINVASGVFDTVTGLEVVLNVVGTTIVGTVGALTVFTISVNADTGLVTLTQDRAVRHDDPNDHDEALGPTVLSLGLNQITLTATIEDGDGDTDSSVANITGAFAFRDDGPSILSVTPDPVTLGTNLIVNGGFEDPVTNLPASQWGLYTTIPGWTAGNNIPFELQRDNVIPFGAHSGSVKVELDGDFQGNLPAGGVVAGDPNNTHTTIQQLVTTTAGSVYQLDFYYSPRPDDGAGDSSGMEVLWNGVVVYTLDGSTPGWQLITLNVTGTGGTDTLAFRGAGAGEENELGAFLDDVSLRQVGNGITDDEDTTRNPAVEVQGGPGDDGSGVVSTGTIVFDAGKDTLDHIEVTGITGVTGQSGALALQVIYVGANGVGTPEALNAPVWVADGLGGGTMTWGSANIPVALTLRVEANGDYTFTQYAPLNHPAVDNLATGASETSFEDNLQLSFGFKVIDKDGDSAVGTIAINVDDDSPGVTTSTVAHVDEDDLTGAAHPGNSDVVNASDDLADPSPVSASGSFGISFGADGAAASGAIANVTLTTPVSSDGVAVDTNLTQVGNDWFGMAGAEQVFKLSFDRPVHLHAARQPHPSAQQPGRQPDAVVLLHREGWGRRHHYRLAVGGCRRRLAGRHDVDRRACR
jgi:T1SS-143 domain-containing protein